MHSAYQRAPQDDLDAPQPPPAPPTAAASYVTAFTTPSQPHQPQQHHHYHHQQNQSQQQQQQPLLPLPPAGFVSGMTGEPSHVPPRQSPPAGWRAWLRRPSMPGRRQPSDGLPPPVTANATAGAHAPPLVPLKPYPSAQYVEHGAGPGGWLAPSGPYPSMQSFNMPEPDESKTAAWTMGPGNMNYNWASGAYPGHSMYRPASPGHPGPGGFDPTLLEASEPDPDLHRTWGIPARAERPGAVKRIELWRGHLVMETPVPPRLLAMLPDRTSREFSHMRYTACTADPNQFGSDGFVLRPSLYNPPRTTELMICLTMYNEDDVLFAKTLNAVMLNIAYLHNTPEWTDQAWKKVVVVIVSDGRQKVHPRTLAVLASLGVYQEGVPETNVQGIPVKAHIFEYTTQFSMDERHNVHYKNITPIQILFCLKEKNQKKINSHRWFFNAFCNELRPEVTILVDVGTVPRSKAIYRLWKTFRTNANVAGACGEIVASKGKLYHDLANPLVGAQNFEYKMSNILDKPLESVFGYISVLPGAFSAYRYSALQNDMGGNGPLAEYFKGELLHGGTGKSDIFTSNMYLAEDRILCWELVTKRGAAWKLHYVKRSQAVTDVPETVPELMGQRRRWLNGSTFAGLHSIVKFYYIYRSRHAWWRKVMLHLELLYQLVNLLFAWLSLGNYFICFWIITKAMAEMVHEMKIPNIILTVVYLITLVMTVILAIGNRPQGSKRAYTRLMIVFAIITTYMTGCAVTLAVLSIKQVLHDMHGGNRGVQLIRNAVFRNIVISVASTFGCWLIASLLWLEPWHMVTSSIQYILMSPTWVNVFSTYAYSNIHDVSWGTKGESSAGGAKAKPGGGAAAEGEKTMVEVTLPQSQDDADERYLDAWELLRQAPPRDAAAGAANPAARAKDYYATVRSNVLLAWIMSNGGLAIGICVISNTSVQILYMGVLLYSAAAIAAIKLLGTIIYLVGFVAHGA